MIRKLFVIILLLVLFSLAVYGLFRIEENIREARKIVVEIPPEYIIPDQISREDIERMYEKIGLGSRARGDYLEVYRLAQDIGYKGVSEWQWEPIFLTGVNIGVALPGAFPTEFRAAYDDYFHWFELIGRMGSNVIRTYTILPPEFYKAFARYNFLNSHRPLWLLQGVWAELPDDGNYNDSDFMTGFQKEIKDAIDVVFGQADIESRPSHAFGLYSQDVSDYTIGFILGREWEPRSVLEHNMLNAGDTRFHGFFFSVPRGNPMECWLARMMDFTMEYESLTYNHQHPLSFVNWLPLDPMYHNSEYIESKKVREYDNDAVALDYRNIHITGLNKAGFFASYHAYPYYPDFVYNDEKYRNYQTDHGPCHYAGYIHDLKSHLKDIPLVIAEFGVPSSRGNSHYAPSGFNQGGHSERRQGEIDSHLSRDIHDQGGAGAVLFSWIDEWFKSNWLVMDFERPSNRRQLWHNMENPEQNFGLVAMDKFKILIDGAVDDWKNAPLVRTEGPIRSVYADADAAYFYLRLQVEPDLNWEKKDILIGINTHDPERGSHYLPDSDMRLGDGLEFLLSIRDPENAYLFVDEPYSVFTDIYNDFIPTYRSAVHDRGNFVEQKLLANRQRVKLDGTVVPKVIHYRSKLRFGRSNPDLGDFESLADWYYDAESGELEIRLTWHLLNVTDPSSRQVLADSEDTPDIETEETDGFTLYFFLREGNRIVQTIPPRPSGGGVYYLWDGWDDPEFSARLKQSYHIIKEVFPLLHDVTLDEREDSIPITARIMTWPEGASGAVSVTFDDGTAGIYEYGYPILKKYGIPATIGVITSRVGDQPSVTGDEGSFSTRYLTWEQIREMGENDWEIASHGVQHVNLRDIKKGKDITSFLTESKRILEEKTGREVITFHYPYSAYKPDLIPIVKRNGYLFARSGRGKYNGPDVSNDYLLDSFVILNNVTPTPSEIMDIIGRGEGKWTILMYHHIFPADAREMKIMQGHGVQNTYSVTPEMFEKHARIIRNSGYFTGTIADIGRYRALRQSAELSLQQFDNFIILSVKTALPPEYHRALTLKFTGPWKIVRVKGGQEDGVYNMRHGELLIDVQPNREVIIEEVKAPHSSEPVPDRKIHQE